MSTQTIRDKASATHVVELTPPGRAAVAVVLVDGPNAVRAADACFRSTSGRTLANTAVDRIVLGRWRAGSSPIPSHQAGSSPTPSGHAGSSATATATATATASGEELIACRRSSDRVEIHCHGGVAAVLAVIERLCEAGCRPLPWHDWLRKAEPDPIRAAAVAALADAPTARTAAILLDQYHDALGGAVRAALASAAAGDWSAATATLDAVLLHRRLGVHLTTPWRVVLAGPPNVGKSSLKNALVGFQRAVVCDLPGTTRDVVTTTTAIDGWPIQLADTAGLRETSDELEAAGVDRALAALAATDLVVLVEEACGQNGDATREAATQFARTAASGSTNTPTLHVLNKIDLVPAAQRPADDQSALLTSALTGEGIDRLVDAIGRRLVPSPPSAGAAVPFTAEQVACCVDAKAAAERHDRTALTACLQPLLAE